MVKGIKAPLGCPLPQRIVKIATLSFVFFLSSSFSVTTRHQVVKVDRGPCGAIYLPLLVLQLTVWSTQINVKGFGHSGQLDHLVCDIRKRQKNTYDILEI